LYHLDNCELEIGSLVKLELTCDDDENTRFWELELRECIVVHGKRTNQLSGVQVPSLPLDGASFICQKCGVE